MNVAYFDCFNGAGGDMIVASLIDAGADADRLGEAFRALGVGGYSLSIEKISKQGLAATRFHVRLEDPKNQPHRHLADIVRIVEGSKLPQSVRQNVVRIFERLAKAEAVVHGTTVQKVHFHEVGAVDAIMDVVGAVLALELLHVDRVFCSPIPTGSGTIMSEHGMLPVPAPATAELLMGVPIAGSTEPGELVTPTAAAILTTMACQFGPLPAMRLSAIGYGAGAREGQTRPNLLRVLVGDLATGGETDSVEILETNLDDATPEMIGHCMERLLNEGALDVYAVPINMKKSRSGVLLTVLCEHHRVSAMERLLFAETTTFGIRRHSATRTKLQHSVETVMTPFGEVQIKIGRGDGIITASPEYEDCRVAADRHGVALREVMAAAQAAWAVRRGNQ